MKPKKIFSALCYGFLFLIILGAVFAPWLTGYSFEEQNFSERLLSMSWSHPFGTDSLGRDQFTRILYGARISLLVGMTVTLISLCVGVSYGFIAGSFGGWVDFVLMRILELVYVFPSLLFAIFVTLLFGQGMNSVILALGFVSWVNQARIVRREVIKLKQTPFIEAAVALGVPTRKILFHHIFPNVSGPIIVTATYQIPSSIMAESFLSFLGLGLKPPLASWGSLAHEGWRAIEAYPHLVIYPGTVLFLTLLSLNFIGDFIKDRLDPNNSY